MNALHVHMILKTILYGNTQNHVNDENTVIHNSPYLHHLRDFE
jgi:hypothetical protein